MRIALENADAARDAAHEAGWPAWLAEFERIATAWDEKHGNLPYELPLTSAGNEGNAMCWRDSYDDGMTPQEAFDSDKSYWEE